MRSLLPRVGGVLLVLLLVAACDAGSTGPPSTPAAPTMIQPTRPADTSPPSPSSPPAASAPAPTPAATATPFDPAAVTVSLEPVVDIPGAPLAMAADPSAGGRLFVAERGGRIWIVRDGQRSDRPFLDIATRVTAGGEQGLLGLALHPDFPVDPRFFIYYTDLDRDNVVAERRVDAADPDRADTGFERELLRMDDFAANHNGGHLAFGPDGFLYVATGDGGGAGDPQRTGQRIDTLLGKILRIDVGDADRPEPYDIPSGNPFASGDGRPEIWHTGLRNPWRFSFDRATGDLWIGDVGQGRWEEVNVARDGVGGLNFGWSVLEGRECFRDRSCDGDGMTLPVAVYSHDLGCSVTGGVVYRGSRWPGLVGAYLFADYCSGRVWAIDAAADQIAEPPVVAETSYAISSFGEDGDGEVYATDLQGQLLRVVAPAR